mmetsp:Transcript_17852/g.53107  ORF Transcript_17852/g.53107 Transcript_17852/m.53107 type:complete len:107 (+) Transcript_17852:184-504(+)
MRGLVLALALGSAAALVPPARRGARSHGVARPASDAADCGACDDWNPFGDGCKPCSDGRSVFINDKRVTHNVLRDIEVVSAYGEREKLDGLMGGGASVVVFLRHLG